MTPLSRRAARNAGIPREKVAPKVHSKELAPTASAQKPSLGLLDLPLELRNEIYLHVIGGILIVTIPPGARNFWAQDAWRKDLHKRLPPCLMLNWQIVREATQEMQHSALHLIKKATVASLDDLLASLPLKTQFSNLRELVMTQPQQSNHELAASPLQSVISRCPQLEELAIRVPVAVLLSDYETYFDPVFELENLQKLNVTCDDAPRDPACAQSVADRPHLGVAQPFEQWFLRKSRQAWLWRAMHLSIDLSPNESRWVDGRSWHQMTEGCIQFVLEWNPMW